MLQRAVWAEPLQAQPAECVLQPQNASYPCRQVKEPGLGVRDLGSGCCFAANSLGDKGRGTLSLECGG